MLPMLMTDMCFQVCGSLLPGHLAVWGTGPRYQAPADQRRPQRDLCHFEGLSLSPPSHCKHPARSSSMRDFSRGKKEVKCPLPAGCSQCLSSAVRLCPSGASRPLALRLRSSGTGLKAMNLSQSACKIGCQLKWYVPYRELLGFVFFFCPGSAK